MEWSLLSRSEEKLSAPLEKLLAKLNPDKKGLERSEINTVSKLFLLFLEIWIDAVSALENEPNAFKDW